MASPSLLMIPSLISLGMLSSKAIFVAAIGQKEARWIPILAAISRALPMPWSATTQVIFSSSAPFVSYMSSSSFLAIIPQIASLNLSGFFLSSSNSNPSGIQTRRSRSPMLSSSFHSFMIIIWLISMFTNVILKPCFAKHRDSSVRGST